MVRTSRDIISANVQHLKTVPAAQPFSSDAEIKKLLANGCEAQILLAMAL
jgi:hypothetical protein